MTKNQKSKTEILELDANITSEKDMQARNSSPIFSKYLILLLTNLVFIVTILFAGWYFWGRQYLSSVETRLSAAAGIKDEVALISDLKELRDTCGLLRKEIDELKSKNSNLEQRQQSYIELQQRLQASINEASEKTVSGNAAEKQDSWQVALRVAINTGSPLDGFRKIAAIPEKVREKLSGIDFIPTYQNIFEEWTKAREIVTLNVYAQNAIALEPSGWWNNFKVFLKSVFRIQRLDENYLTPEEVFVRQIEKLLAERNIEGLLEWIKLYEGRIDTNTKAMLKTWSRKLEQFRQGQSVLEMVK